MEHELNGKSDKPYLSGQKGWPFHATETNIFRRPKVANPWQIWQAVFANPHGRAAGGHSQMLSDLWHTVSVDSQLFVFDCICMIRHWPCKAGRFRFTLCFP